jgi:hypothetical protein
MRTLHERPSRDQREGAFFETFQSLANDLPVGSWQKSESPDYLLQTTLGPVGLEVTSLVDGRLAAIKAAQDKALDTARLAAEKDGIQPIEVTAQFRDNDAPVDYLEAGKELYAIVRKRLGQLNDRGPREYTPSSSRYFLGVMVQLGTLDGKPWLKGHRWQRMHINWMKRDPVEWLQQTIADKDAKLSEYLTKCAECWLLVGVNEWAAPEAVRFTPEGLSYQYHTGFKRVYVLENVDGNLYRLRIDSTDSAWG